MFSIDDLIGIPYKAHGRDSNGLDCYGLILECCRRAGHPIKDVWYEHTGLELVDFAEFVGLKRLDSFCCPCIVEMEYAHRLHLGFVIDNTRMINATFSGVCLDKIGTYKVLGYYIWDK